MIFKTVDPPEPDRIVRNIPTQKMLLLLRQKISISTTRRKIGNNHMHTPTCLSFPVGHLTGTMYRSGDTNSEYQHGRFTIRASTPATVFWLSLFKSLVRQISDSGVAFVCHWYNIFNRTVCTVQGYHDGKFGTGTHHQWSPAGLRLSPI